MIHLGSSCLVWPEIAHGFTLDEHMVELWLFCFFSLFTTCTDVFLTIVYILAILLLLFIYMRSLPWPMPPRRESNNWRVEKSLQCGWPTEYFRGPHHLDLWMVPPLTEATAFFAVFHVWSSQCINIWSTSLRQCCVPDRLFSVDQE